MATPMSHQQWWAEHYTQLDHRDIFRASEMAWQAGFLAAQQSTVFTGCKVCGVDTSKPRGYCCNNTQCPGRITC